MQASWAGGTEPVVLAVAAGCRSCLHSSRQPPSFALLLTALAPHPTPSARLFFKCPSSACAQSCPRAAPQPWPTSCSAAGRKTQRSGELLEWVGSVVGGRSSPLTRPPNPHPLPPPTHPLPPFPLAGPQRCRLWKSSEPSSPPAFEPCQRALGGHRRGQGLAQRSHLGQRRRHPHCLNQRWHRPHCPTQWRRRRLQQMHLPEPAEASAALQGPIVKPSLTHAQHRHVPASLIFILSCLRQLHLCSSSAGLPPAPFSLPILCVNPFEYIASILLCCNAVLHTFARLVGQPLCGAFTGFPTLLASLYFTQLAHTRRGAEAERARVGQGVGRTWVSGTWWQAEGGGMEQCTAARQGMATATSGVGVSSEQQRSVNRQGRFVLGVSSERQ